MGYYFVRDFYIQTVALPTQDQYLFQNNERFELVLKGINAGVYELDLSTQSFWWSSKFYDLLGYKRGEIESSLEMLLNHLVIPEKRQELNDLLTNGAKNSDPFSLDVQLLHQNGSYRWFKITGQTKWQNNEAIYLIGALEDIEHRIANQKINQKNEFLLEEAGLMAKVGGWELDMNGLSVTWSKEVCIIHEVAIGYVPTLEEAINFYSPDYLPLIQKAVNEALDHGTSFDLELKIITAKKRELWVRSIGKAIYNNQGNKIIGLRGVFQDIDEQKKIELEKQNNELLLEDVGRMARIGGWEVNPTTMQGTWSKEVTLIHEMPIGYQPSLEEALNFVSPAYRETIQKVVSDGLTYGIPFDEELKIITSSQREIWVRAIGKAVYDDKNENIIAIRGVFQDIDEQKEKELALAASANLIQEQNQRLVNFAHIVSHNLTSHATNLALTLRLLESETDPNEVNHFKENLKKISKSLNQTMSHLNDIIVIQTENNPLKKTVKFEEVFTRIIATLKPEIEESKAEISFDFKACPEIEYIPAYLESILLNLTSNAIKYRNPANPLKINLKTYRESGRPALLVSDNGLGIDLEKYGSRIFGMYKTFHKNPNARGIGLFITKSQIEAMGGKISAESAVNKGSTFKIIF